MPDDAAPAPDLPTFTAQATQHPDLVCPDPDYTLHSVTPGPAGEAVCVWSGPTAVLGRETAPNGVSYALTRTPADYRLLVTVQSPNGGAAVHVVVADVALPLFQPLPGGRLLLVGTRARWTETGGEHNAQVRAADGSVEMTACLGDGVAAVRTTSDGSVWLTYFDEGIWGSYGWRGGIEPADNRPVGSQGVAHVDPGLTSRWTPEETVYEVGAITTTDGGVLVVHGMAAVRNGPELTFLPEERSAGTGLADEVVAVAADGDRVALVSRPRGGHATVLLGHLTPAGFASVARGPLPGDAQDPDRQLVVAGAGSTLHLWSGERWRSVDVETLFAGIQA